jgi:hypothetical protein
MQWLFETKTDSDCQLVSMDKQSFKAHKLIMCRFPKFRDQFALSTDSVLSLSYPPSVVAALLRFIYLDKLPEVEKTSFDEWKQLFLVAQANGMSGLSDAVCEVLETKISNDTFGPIVQLIKSQSGPDILELEKQLTAYIAKNAKFAFDLIKSQSQKQETSSGGGGLTTTSSSLHQPPKYEKQETSSVPTPTTVIGLENAYRVRECTPMIRELQKYVSKTTADGTGGALTASALVYIDLFERRTSSWAPFDTFRPDLGGTLYYIHSLAMEIQRQGVRELDQRKIENYKEIWWMNGNHHGATHGTILRQTSTELVVKRDGSDEFVVIHPVQCIDI